MTDSRHIHPSQLGRLKLVPDAAQEVAIVDSTQKMLAEINRTQHPKQPGMRLVTAAAAVVALSLVALLVSLCVKGIIWMWS